MRGFRSPRVLVEAHRFPQPPYAAGVSAAIAGASAMVDVSDGLVADAGHVAVASGVAIDLRSADLQVAEPIQAAAAAYNADPLGWVLGGGEDHALLATFPPEAIVPAEFTVVGDVRAGGGEVSVDGRPWAAGPSGHAHFR